MKILTIFNEGSSIVLDSDRKKSTPVEVVLGKWNSFVWDGGSARCQLA